MSLILAADTSTNINAVALCRAAEDGALSVIAETTVSCARRHAERLLDTVAWLLSEGGIKLEDLDLLAIAHGPGSFTGLRIGVATWKGLAFSTGLPLVGVPTLDAMAHLAAGAEGIICPVLDARMAEIFGAAYRVANSVHTPLLSPRVAPVSTFLEDLANAVPNESALFLGDALDRYQERAQTWTMLGSSPPATKTPASPPTGAASPAVPPSPPKAGHSKAPAPLATPPPWPPCTCAKPKP